METLIEYLCIEIENSLEVYFWRTQIKRQGISQTHQIWRKNGKKYGWSKRDVLGLVLRYNFPGLH